MTNKQAVIFDFGGVLVQMVDERPRLELAERLGVPLSQIDHLVFASDSARKASYGEFTVQQHWEAVREALHIPSEDMPTFLEEYWSADDLNWELLDFIKYLRPRFKVGLLSNAWDDLRQTMHARWNIDGLFDDMVISAEVGIVKPDPRIFHLAVERLGVLPTAAIFIDDMLVNVEAARKQGLVAIQFINNQETLPGLQRLIEAGESMG